MNIVDGYRVEAVVFAPEVGRHVAGANQLTFGAVYPTVIRTGELAGVTALLETYQGTAVPANIRECANHVILAADDDRRLVRNFDDLEIARLGELRHVSGKDPVAHDDPVEFQLVDLWIGIKALLERPAGFLADDQFADGPVILHRILGVTLVSELF